MSKSRLARRCPARLVSSVLWSFAAAVAAPGVAAADCLQQMAIPAGCVWDAGAFGCSGGVAMLTATDAVISPDGTKVYLAANFSDAVSIFDRDTTTGLLTQKTGTAGCVSQTGTGGACVDGEGLDGARALAVSPDGEHAYVASNGSDAIAVFDRDQTTGALTQKAGTAGCISDTGSFGACATGVGLDRANDITLSPDGNNVYVVSTSDNSVAVFDRAPDGTLAQKAGTSGCISETGDGGSCTDGTALQGAASVVVSPDGESLYVGATTSDSVAIFDRDPLTGAISQKAGTAGCISDNGLGGLCQDGTAMDAVTTVTVSPDGRNVYATAGVTFLADGSLTIFDRDLITGELMQKAGTAGCISDSGSGGACSNGRSFAGVGTSSSARTAKTPTSRRLGATASRTSIVILPPAH